jgi:hypothetical protein
MDVLTMTLQEQKTAVEARTIGGEGYIQLDKLRVQLKFLGKAIKRRLSHQSKRGSKKRFVVPISLLFLEWFLVPFLLAFFVFYWFFLTLSTLPAK